MKRFGFLRGFLLAMLLTAATALGQTTLVLTAGQVGVVYPTKTVSGPTGATYGITGLPSGMSINGTSGEILGTPQAAGTFTGVISVRNPATGLTDTQPYSLTIAAAAAAPAITSAATVSGTVGQSFSYTVAASNTPTSFNVGTLPAGLSFNSATNLITGTPTTARTTNVSLSANNSAGTGAATTLVITIAPAGPVPVVTSATTAAATAATATTFTVNYQITASNSPLSFAATNLPLGVSLNTGTGLISGTTSIQGSYSVGLSATNNNGTSETANLTLTVGALSAITNATTANATTGTAFSFTPVATNSPTSFTINGLPSGLAANTTTGAITGTPTRTGTFSVTLTANNVVGTGPTSTLTLTIDAPSGGGGGGGGGGAPNVTPPSITSATTATAVVGVPFSYTLVAAPSITTMVASGPPAGIAFDATTGVLSGTFTTAGTYSVTLVVYNGGGSAAAVLVITVNTRPSITAQPQSTALSVGGGAILSVTATGTPAPTYQWRKNGAAIAGATAATLTLANFQVSDAGAYAVDVTNVAGTVRSQSAAIGVVSTVKVVGAGTEVGQNIVHPNGNVYDQVLLTGSSATITADNGQVTRTSFIDLNDDIVQVEFSGAGTLTLTLENASGPAAPVKYNQPGVAYMKGHASLVITGANETTNVSVFSVGTVTAVNQSLFPAGMTYDGMADIGLISIATTNGKFGGLRTANASYFRTSGLTGVYAPGVAMQGPVFIGDITADGDATGAMVFGSTTDVRITGGDLLQMNARALQIDGLTSVRFTDGTKSSGATLPAQTNRGRLERNGVDMTGSVVR